MKIAQITFDDTVFYFEPAGRPIEICAYYGQRQDGTTRVGAGWFDFTSAKGIPIKILKKPPWTRVAAVKIAQDALRDINKGGPAVATHLAHLSALNAEFWATRIDRRRKPSKQVARDIFILLILPIWERKNWSGGMRAAQLEEMGIEFSKDGDRSRIMLATRISALRKKYSS